MLDPIHAKVFEGVDSAAVRAGYSTMLGMTSHLEMIDATRADVLVHGKVDGIIVQDTYSYDALPEYLQKRNVPFVLTLRRTGNHTYAAIDDWFGGQLAADCLLKNAPRSQIIVSPAAEYSTFDNRISGFRERWAAQRDDDVEVVVSGVTADEGRQTARMLLEREELPDSIFVCNDQTAAGVMVEFWNSGYRAGEDFALVGFHGIEIAELLPKPMTTIASPLAQLGRASVDLLLALIDGQSPASVMFAPTLVERESSTLHRR